MFSKARNWIIAIGIYYVVGFNLTAQGQPSQTEFRFRHYSKDDGLDNGYTERIITDSLGYVWSRSNRGLLRFDGYNFKAFEYDPHDSNRIALKLPISDVITDATGNIWLRHRLRRSKSSITLTKYDWKLDKFTPYEIKTKGIGYLRFEKDNSTIWAARGYGGGLLRFNFNSAEVREFINPHGDSTQVNSINTIKAIKNYDNYLLLSTDYGLWIFDKASHQFSRPPSNPRDSSLLYQSPMGWFMPLKSLRKKDPIWVRTETSIIKFDSTFSIVQRAEKMPVGIESLDTDQDGIWFRFAREDGLFYYNLQLDTVINVRYEPGNKFSLASNNINEISVDRSHSVWMATQQGISRLMRSSINYQNVSLPALRSSILYQVGEEEYLVWSQGKKILSTSLKNNLALSKGLKENILPINQAIVSRFWKGEKYLWASIVSEIPPGAAGVLGFPINPETNMIEDGALIHLEEQPGNVNTIANRFCHDVLESNGSLWIAHAVGALSRVDLSVPYGRSGSVTRYYHVDGDTNSIVSSVVLSLFPEDKNSIWALTLDGVDLLHFDDGENVTFEHVFDKRELPGAIFRSADGNLFLGTMNGLYQANKKDGRYRFIYIPSFGRRPIDAIQEDQLGRLWLKTNKTLICFDREKGTVVEFGERDGIDHLLSFDLKRHRSQNAMHRTRNGWLLVTDPDGATFFDPMSFKIDTRQVVPVFTNLLVNNRPPHVGDHSANSDSYIIPYQVGALSELALDYQHNNFSIEFSAMEMIAPEKNRYRHKLENYDNDWIETDFKNRTATYTNLDPGNYVLKVVASNHHGVWSDSETVLAVRILPPPWRTWWAYSLYGVAFFGLLLTWRSYEIKRVKLKHRAEHLIELDTLKTQFFANISHEFRTPITLLLGPLKEMYNKAKNGEDRSSLNTMIKNGQRLLRLINQLLDLSKLEAGKMGLRAAPVDVVQFIREITSSYTSWSADKKIKYTFYHEVPELTVYIDREKIETIVHNLISNAFKFTPESGEVIVHLRKPDKEWVQLVVKDSGIGIPPDQLEKIFDRFHQVDNSKTRAYEGSGLGMALAKELVEIHHGKISVDSTVGKGTTFTVQLPMDKKRFSRDEIVEFDEPHLSTAVQHTDIATTEVEASEQEVISNGELPVLLIVEDNIDMRHFIRKILMDSYQIIEADDGRAGVSKAEQAVPDLIISDVMMPEMDGYELCEKIKTNELTSHVPVILLTAKADHDSKITGLQTGADDYLSKPFDAEELKLVVRNRIHEITKLRERFSKEVTLEPRKIAITSLDEKFLTKVMDVIETRMSDELFSIEELASEVGYSNMHLYRKIKALSGQTPSVFLRTIRLKRAAELLAKNSDNVTQIAYSVGFSSLSYFTKCFKDQFGVTPGQYAEAQER